MMFKKASPYKFCFFEKAETFCRLRDVVWEVISRERTPSGRGGRVGRFKGLREERYIFNDMTEDRAMLRRRRIMITAAACTMPWVLPMA